MVFRAVPHVRDINKPQNRVLHLLGSTVGGVSGWCPIEHALIPVKKKNGVFRTARKQKLRDPE